MSPTHQVAIRLTHEVVQRVDAFARDTSLPGVPLSRSDAIRVLLEKALTAEGYAAGGGPAAKAARPAKGKAKQKPKPKPKRADSPPARPRAANEAGQRPSTGDAGDVHDRIAAALDRAFAADAARRRPGGKQVYLGIGHRRAMDDLGR